MSNKKSGAAQVRRAPLPLKSNNERLDDAHKTVLSKSEHPLSHATAIASEEALRKFWDTPEEDKA